MTTRRRKDDDFRAEIDAHLEQETEELRLQGMTSDEARAAARKAFGNRTIAEERFYESRRWLWLDHLFRDLRIAARVLAKDPRFSILAVLGLALGIGISTAVFAVIQASIRANTAASGGLSTFVSLNRLQAGNWSNDFTYDDHRAFPAAPFRAVKAESGRYHFALGP